MPKVLMSVKLEPDLMEWVRSQAERAGVDRTSIVVEALETFRSRRSAPKGTLQASDGRRPEVEPVRTKPEGRGSRPAPTEPVPEGGLPIGQQKVQRVRDARGQVKEEWTLTLTRYEAGEPVWERVP